MFQASTIPAYLVDRGLISAGQIVDGGLAVSDASRRNTNFRVESESGPSYLLKQGVGKERAATVAHEGAIYTAFQPSSPKKSLSKSFARYLPPYYGYDDDSNALILGLLPAAETILERHTRTGRFSVEVARSVGQALAALHSIGAEESAALAEVLAHSTYGREPHWILSMHRPYLRDLDIVSSANIRIVKLVQSFPEFCDLLDQLRGEWVESSGPEAMAHTPIHCDIKWNNILVPSGRGHITLVDWELARMGDPCWDVGSFFGEYLTFWLLSIPATGQDPPDHFLSLARYPLEKMWPAMRAFWLAYMQAVGLSSDVRAANRFLLRSVRYAAVRLLQTAYEQGQGSALLTGTILVLLQVALNILQRPAEALISLLGIPMQMSRPR